MTWDFESWYWAVLSFDDLLKQYVSIGLFGIGWDFKPLSYVVHSIPKLLEHPLNI